MCLQAERANAQFVVSGRVAVWLWPLNRAPRTVVTPAALGISARTSKSCQGSPVRGPTEASYPSQRGVSKAIDFCPEAVVEPARWWPWDLPGGGHGICPGGLATTGLGAQLKGLTPCPVRAWDRRTLSPVV